MTNARKKIIAHGFTLIEITIAVAIFTVIMVIGTSALLSANTAYQVSHNQSALMDNLNFMMEDMTRNIRLGENYDCIDGNTLIPQNSLTTLLGTVLSLAATNVHGDCQTPQFYFVFSGTGSDPTIPGSQTAYVFAPWSADGQDHGTHDGDLKLFKYTPAASGLIGSFSNITPAAITIDPIQSGFIVNGSDPTDNFQPTVLISLAGTITYENITTPFHLETTITQRANDNGTQ